jgi:hypothetical protein
MPREEATRSSDFETFYGQQLCNDFKDLDTLVLQLARIEYYMYILLFALIIDI